MHRVFSRVCAASAFALVSAFVQPDCSAQADGPRAVEMVEEPTLPGFTLYYPAHLASSAPLPVFIWGEGSCKDVGSLYRNFNSEIAAHGYFVIAIGHIDESVKLPPAPRPTKDTPVAILPTTPIPLPYATPVDRMIVALDWVSRQKTTENSRYRLRLDAARIATMGHSCGGIQAAWTAIHDTRVKTLIYGNSGILDQAVSGIALTRSDLETLKIPVLYLLGGPTDIAHPIGHEDLLHYRASPVFIADMNVGHGATYAEPKGGAFAEVTVAWLDWQFKDDPRAASSFTGPNCRLCKDDQWTVVKRNLP